MPIAKRCEDLLCNSLARNGDLPQTLKSKKGRSGAKSAMTAHLCHREGAHLVLQEVDGSVHHGALPGEDTRRVRRADLQKLLLGEAGPHQHVVTRKMLTNVGSGRNALRVLDVGMEVQRRLQESVVFQELVCPMLARAKTLSLRRNGQSSNFMPRHKKGLRTPLPPS